MMATTQQLQQQRNIAMDRYQAFETRPTTLAAKEFFNNGTTASSDWRSSLPQRVRRLCQVLENWTAENGSPELSCSFSLDPKESRRLAMTAAIMAHADSSFLKCFQKFFIESLNRRTDYHYNNNSNDDDDDDGVVQQQRIRHSNEFKVELLFFNDLRSLGWIRREGLLQEPLETALHCTIHNWVRTTISSEFEQDTLYPQIEEYQNCIVLPWLQDLVGLEALHNDKWTSRIQYSAAECFCLVRNSEIFDLVADYPDSHPAVLELKAVLERTKMYSALGQSLKEALVRRLNHPGANTSQIIDVYINTIKVLREIDPSDRILQVVAEPVRSYLRRRHNTVRCIITSLTDAEVGGELYEELRRQDARPLEHLQADSDEEEEEPDMDWQPPPPITKAKGSFFAGTTGGGGDILSMLVSIYGSKELFVNEYRLMLADKLLANLDFNTDKEVHTLELLKLRFGELSMRHCEIMIKDTDDSKRIVSNIHNTLKTNNGDEQQDDRQQQQQQDPLVDAAIVSHIFWPTLQNEQFKHHPRLQAGLDKFGLAYAELKNPRRLVWLNQLGTVQIELDVLEEKEDGTEEIETREFSVTPLLATLISHFEDKECWTVEDLSNETTIPEHIIEKRMQYWVNNRVIQQIPNSNPIEYAVATRDHLIQGKHDGHHHHDDMDEDGHKSVSVVAQDEEEMEIYESYICGMLTNMGQLPLDRIHNMLKMFVTGSEIKYNKTPQQLSQFLKYLCKKERLECVVTGSEITYQLRNKNQ